MTSDEADLRKFGIEMGLFMDQPLIDAFERGIDHQWFALVDISTHCAAARGKVMRIFRLTDAGMDRLAALSKSEGVGHG